MDFIARKELMDTKSHKRLSINNTGDIDLEGDASHFDMFNDNYWWNLTGYINKDGRENPWRYAVTERLRDPRKMGPTGQMQVAPMCEGVLNTFLADKRSLKS